MGIKYSYSGFLQEEAVALGLDLIVLAVLRYFVDFVATGKMVVENIAGEDYYWLRYDKVLENNPIFYIKNKEVLSRRLSRLIDLKILKRHILRRNGVYTFFCLGENYSDLVPTKKSGTGQANKGQVKRKKSLPKEEKLDTKDSSIKDSSIKDIEYIYSFWNDSGIHRHRSLTGRIKSRIYSSLREYSREEILGAIGNYGRIVNSGDYFFDYRWTLVDFLTRGLEKFLDFEIASRNYRRGEQDVQDYGGDSGKYQGEDFLGQIREAERNRGCSFREEEADF